MVLCSVVLCPPYRALFVTLGSDPPAVVVTGLRCVCHAPHFRPPAVVALRQVCGANMASAVARFGAVATSSHPWMHFRPPAVDALRQVFGAKVAPTIGAVASFGATAASSPPPMRGSWMTAFGARALAVTSRGCRPLSSPARSIEAELKEKFEATLPSHASRSAGFLFHDWDACRASLPVRVHKGDKNKLETLTLHTLQFWGLDEDLKTMKVQLESPSPVTRGTVKYVCAPGGSGKTTSIIPAFLESKVFTHHLHLAFHNDGRRNFKL